jgi:ketosteroid isomerase-like protein
MSSSLIVNLFRAIDYGDWEAMAGLVDDGVVYERPGYDRAVGRDQLLHFYQHERIVASGTHLLDHIVVEGDYGACWGRFCGLTKNGSTVDELFADVYRFREGKIQERRSHFFRPAI